MEKVRTPHTQFQTNYKGLLWALQEDLI